MTGWPSVSAVSSHRAVSASVAEKLVDLADSLWKPLEYLARDLDVRSKDTNCPEDTAKVAPKKKLTNAARRTLVPIPGYTRNARKRAQLKAGIA
ncbi:hypothetical protein PHYPSEUDO_015396 [Phytophthora pseudosyringae]|uniref:Uncharacterized protein n=1 Tax=Phytophthora pseudosyringae TaxID=221518 RepID=A0A8T1V383_9STRA|nr:hypothetical protein PHYPSEUDO_015396 [Phytophthora pseudosyringae]